MKMYKSGKSADWNNAVMNSPDGGFLQSWAWGEFQEALGNPVFNFSNEDKTWFAQCIQLKAGGQRILSIPRGPVFTGQGDPDGDSLSAFLSELKAFAKERGCFLLRFDPPYDGSWGLGIGNWATRSLKVTNPEHTLIVHTSKSEEELLKGMKSKWRYNIGVAQKHEVKTRWGSTEKDASLFWRLVVKTTARQGFASYDEEYFKTLIRILAPQNQASFLFAEEKGKTIAGILVCRFGNRSIYLHGASDHAYRKVMAPHLLQWEAIKNAKANKSCYDFWGVAADPPANKAEKHWGGVTRFKKGFAPDARITEYVGTYEMGVKPLWYWLYRIRGIIKS